RRTVTGDGIGGRPPPDAPAVLDAATNQQHISRAGMPSDAAGRAISPSTGGSSLDLGSVGAGAVLSSADSTVSAAADTPDGGDGGDVAAGGKRAGRDVDHVENGVSRPIGKIVGSLALPLHPSDSLHEIQGLRIVVPPAPGRARFVRNARTSRFAVRDDEEEQEEQEDFGGADGDGQDGRRSVNRAAALQLGVVVEFDGDWKPAGDEAKPSDSTGPAPAAAGATMIRMTPEIFGALENLDREDFFAVTAAARRAAPPPAVQQSPVLLRAQPLSPSAAATAGSSSVSSPGLSLELHLLSKAFDGDVRLRPASIAKLQLVIGWLFPKAVDGFLRPPGGHTGDDSETPPSAAEILHALDAARSTDPDIRAAIQQGPRAPLPQLDELVISLRHHQKAAIQWMLDIEKGSTANGTHRASNETHSTTGAMPLDDDAANKQKARQAKDGAGESAAAVLPRRALPGFDAAGNRGETGTALEAEEKLEQNALLLGWVRLAFLPPPSADATVGVEIRERGDDDQNAGSNTRAMEGPDPAAVTVNGGAENGFAVPVVAVERGTVLAGNRRDAPDEREPGGKTASKAAANKSRGKNPRGGSVSTTLRSAAPAVDTVSTPPEAQSSPRAVTAVGEGGQATTPTGFPRGGVLRAGLNHGWFHVPSARLATELPKEWVAFADVSGGILADEMGLGKTVEMLGCILANPYPPPADDDGVPAPPLPNGSGSSRASAPSADDSRSGSSAAAATGSGEDGEDGGDGSSAAEAPTGKSNYWDDLTPADEGSACICGRGDDEPLAPGDLCFVQCDSCGWWLHGGCCGFVPASEGEDEEEREFTCVVCSCLALLKAPKRCGTTLIICPHKIRSQWEREITARTKAGALKVTVYNGVKEILSSGEKAKLASSKRRTSKRRRDNASSNVNDGDGDGEGGPSTVNNTEDDTNTNAVSSSHGGASQSNRSDISDSNVISGGGSGRPKRRKTGDPSQDEGPRPSPGPETAPDAGIAVSGAGAVGPEDDAEIETATPAAGGSNGDVGVGGAAAVGDGGAGGVDGRNGDAEDVENHPFALLSPETLASYDVVLTTFEVLRAEVHHAESRFAGVSGDGGAGGAGAGAAGRPSLRRKKRYRVVPSPLPALKWWRVVVDEAHMVENSTQETAKMALKIPATFRWCVTGTPIGKGSVDDLYGLLVFLKASPLDDKTVWAKAIREPIDRRLPGAMERLAVALKQVMWRVTKSSVAAQINIPPQNTVDRRLSFSSVEEHFYRKQHRAAAADAQRTAREGGRGTEEKMFNSLLALRQACCHPCIGSGGIERAPAGGGSRLGGGGLAAGAKGGGQGRWLSMGQILDRLIDEERLKAEEAQRKVILNLNASGAVARLILQAQERRSDAAAGAAAGDGERDDRESPETLLRDSISSYRRALQMAQDNRTPGPLTGGAEVTGSRTFLLPSRVKRHPRKAPVAGYTASGPVVAFDPATADAAAIKNTTAAPASAATAAVFMELRKPLELAWNVELVTSEAAEVAKDVKGVRAAAREAQEVLGLGRVEECTTGEGGGVREERSGTGCSRPRDPAWARLVFSDRKRVTPAPHEVLAHFERTQAKAMRVRKWRTGIQCLNLSVHPRPSRSLYHHTAASLSAFLSQTLSRDTERWGVRDTASGTSAETKPETGSIKGAVAAAVGSTSPGATSRGKLGGRRRRRDEKGTEHGTAVCYPRGCVLQASSQAGMFEDVVRFSLEAPSSQRPVRTIGSSYGEVDKEASPLTKASDARPGEEEGENDNDDSHRASQDGDQSSSGGEHQWKEVVVPPSTSVRAREWRIVVETCQLIFQGKRRRDGGGVPGPVRVGMEVELMEAEVDADSLQMLHAAHNLLDVLDHTKERQLQLPVRTLPTAEQTPEQLRQMIDRVKADYIASAVGIHRSSRLQLQEAGRASAEALEAAAKNRIGGLEWWEAALRYMESSRDDGNFVQRAQLELLHEKAGQYGVMVRRSFPTFDSVGGLRMALSMKIKEAATKRKGVLRKLEALSTDPGPMEVHSNSNCRRCRADWGKTGPICGHCKVEEHIDAWEACVVYFRRPLKNTTAAPTNPGIGGGGSAGLAPGEAGPGVNNAHQGHTFKEPSATPRLLRLIQRWAEDWAALSAESKDFLASWEASERELLASRALWRAHLDLLSNIDELGSCVTPLRLADPAEEPRLGLLTDDQRRMVLTEGVLGIRRREYELERQASAHALESSRGQLSRRHNLVVPFRSGETSGAAKECAVCQDDLVEEVAVLPCGHTFHPECIGFLRKVGGNGGRFRCPTCRRSSSASDVRFASTLDQLDGSAAGWVL
ncbi:unnamed protein product, partial [Scytosiphon promiscuus]